MIADRNTGCILFLWGSRSPVCIMLGGGTAMVVIDQAKTLKIIAYRGIANLLTPMVANSHAPGFERRSRRRIRISRRRGTIRRK